MPETGGRGNQTVAGAAAVLHAASVLRFTAAPILHRELGGQIGAEAEIIQIGNGPHRTAPREKERLGPPGMQDAAHHNRALLLYRHGLGGVVMSMVACCFLAMLPEQSAGMRSPLMWLGAMMLILLVRGADVVLVLQRGIEAAYAETAIGRFSLGVISSALMWALFPILFFPVMNGVDRTYMATILSGMAGGSATVLAPVHHVAWFYCGALLVPASVMFLLAGGQPNVSLGLLGLVFFCIMVMSSRVTYQAMMNTLSLRVALNRASRSLEAETEERRQAEARLRQNQRLEAVGHLTAGVAYDFNNLLMVIGSNAELLGRQVDDRPDLAARVATILTATDKGGRLTQQLLAFARNQPMQPRSTDLNAIIRDMDRLISSSMNGSVALHFDLCPTLWPVFVDPAQMAQVVINLAANAREAMAAGGILTIRTANLDRAAAAGLALSPGADYVMLSVADNGTGMSKDVLQHAFEPFFTTKPPGKGSGLGLSEVHGIVRQSGGATAIQSEPGRGTTVAIYLPRLRTGERPEPADALG